jgi:type II secretory pathway component PulF
MAWWPASAEEMEALADEIASLRLAGVPLAEGLREVALDQPERLSQIASWVAERLEQGAPLAEALGALRQ